MTATHKGGGHFVVVGAVNREKKTTKKYDARLRSRLFRLFRPSLRDAKTTET